MPRKPSANTEQVTFRVPSAWVKEAEALVKAICLPGMTITRTDVFRMAIAEGLKKLKLEYKAK